STSAVPRKPVEPVMAMRFPASCSAITGPCLPFGRDVVRRPVRVATVTVVAASADAPRTADRVIEAAIESFGTRGYGATSLDALAAELGIRKQTILYWFPSKEALLGAVIDRCADDLSEALEAALSRAGRGWDRVEAVVRAVFRLALRRPALLGLLREVSRLGSPWSTRLTDQLDPLVDRARAFLDAEMDAGTMRRTDPRL